MTTTAPVAEPTAPPAAGDTSGTGNADPPSLIYATPWPKHAWAPSAPAQRLFWQGVRKVVFAGGLGLIVYGVASIASDVNRHAAPVAAAWGVGFVALMLPVPFRPRRRRKRRRQAPAGGAAAGPASGI